MSVTIELYGVVRKRAGTDMVRVDAGTVGGALAALEKACPALAGSVVTSGSLGEHYRLSLNGRDFISDPERSLADGDRLILLSAEAGG